MNRGKYKIISGGVDYELAERIANELKINVVKTELKRFANGERYVRLEENVRNCDVFIIQSVSETKGYSLNDAIMELLLLVDAARRASASEITAVLPFMPYARQDRKTREREAISVALVLKILRAAGVDRILTMDLHSMQTQAAFDGPFENISAKDQIINKLRRILQGKKEDFVLVAPDAGSVKNTSKYASILDVDMVFLPKFRDEKESSRIVRPKEVKGVEKKKCIIVDDMIDTGRTLIGAINVLNMSGAKETICVATHGILSKDACERFKDCLNSKIITTDTLLQGKHKKILGNKIDIIPIAPVLADSIKKIHNGEILEEVNR